MREPALSSRTPTRGTGSDEQRRAAFLAEHMFNWLSTQRTRCRSWPKHGVQYADPLRRLAPLPVGRQPTATTLHTASCTPPCGLSRTRCGACRDWRRWRDSTPPRGRRRLVLIVVGWCSCCTWLIVSHRSLAADVRHDGMRVSCALGIFEGSLTTPVVNAFAEAEVHGKRTHVTPYSAVWPRNTEPSVMTTNVRHTT